MAKNATWPRDRAWAEREIARVSDWILQHVRDAGRSGVVLGLSGGIDSALVAALASRALPGRVWAYALPCHSLPDDVRDAALVARRLGVAYRSVDLDSVFDALMPVLEEAGGEARPLSRANLKPRLRMITLNYLAAQKDALVLGTGNASELHVGYFTKWGDGGVDLLPIGHLVKSEVWLLGKVMALPEFVLQRTPSAGLWEGQSDEKEMGITYADLDAYLRRGPEAVAPDISERIRDMHAKSAHKRALPPTPAVN